MRIFLICQQALRRHAVPAYAFWEHYFKQGLREAGHEVCEAANVDWAEGLTGLTRAERRRWLDRSWSTAVAAIREIHQRCGVDLALCYLFPEQVEPSAISTIRDLGVPCVNFFCDNVREFTKLPDAFHGFDLHWVPEADARRLYQSAGVRFVYAPMPVWVPPEQRILPEHEVDGVLFLGSRDALREDLLGEVAATGLKLRVGGRGWENDSPAPAQQPGSWLQRLGRQAAFVRRHGFGAFVRKFAPQRQSGRDSSWIEACRAYGPLEPEAYATASRESAVTLGINRYPSFRRQAEGPAVYSRLRDIEAPMLGACYLTEAAPGLDDLYEIGCDIETYRTAGELAEQARRLLADPEERRRLRSAGQKRALNEHTIGRSMEKLARALR